MYCLYRGPGENLINGVLCPVNAVSRYDNFCLEHNRMPQNEKERCMRIIKEEGRSLMKHNWGK